LARWSRAVIVLPVFVALIAPGSPAEAQPADDTPGWYATLGGAYQKRLRSGESATTYTEFEPGYAVSAGFGYQFLGGLGLDGEVGFMRNNTDVVASDVTGPAAGVGHVTARSVMANVRYTVLTGGPIVPYVGFGIGGYRAQLHGLSNVIAADFGFFADGTSEGVTFAYQVRTGAEFPVHPNLALQAGYRFFRGSPLEFRGTMFGDLNPTGARTHSLELGARFRF
jgi:opacity protein-like surface antigen